MLGARQLVLMTRIAMGHPKGVTRRMISALRLSDCEHPTGDTGKRLCHCWNGIDAAKVLEGLVRRGMIQLDVDERYYLTTKGWRLVDRERRAPVSVDAWTRLGTPRSFSVRRSQRAEFQVLR